MPIPQPTLRPACHCLRGFSSYSDIILLIFILSFILIRFFHHLFWFIHFIYLFIFICRPICQRLLNCDDSYHHLLCTGLGREIRVGCTGDVGEMEVKDERPHWEQMDAYMKSTFCLMLPGDSQTSRRLPESIMAGCIPVFPGPPYHTAAFASQVEYHKFAIFFKFNATPWTDSITVRWKADHGGLPGKKPHHPTDAEWWVPDVNNVENLVVSVNGPVEMVKYLRDMPASRIREKQHALQKVQPKFAYLEHSGAEKRDPSAADVIVDAMCQRWENQRKQEKVQAQEADDVGTR